MDKPAPRMLCRHRLQFGLRTLLVFITVFGVWFGFYMQRVRRQKEAVRAIREFGGWVTYDFQETSRAGVSFFDAKAEPPFPKWLISHLGEDFFFNVAACSFDPGDNITPNARRAPLHVLGAFPKLRELYLKDDQATDDGLRIIGTLNHLRILYLWACPEVTDAGIVHLANLSNLEKIAITNSRIGDDSLGLLGSRPKMQAMLLQFNQFSDKGLARLKGCDHLRTLSLGYGSTKITDAGMPFLGSLTHLEELDLQGTGVTSAGLGHLEALKTLKQINLFGTRVADTSSFRKALPKCRVFR